MLPAQEAWTLTFAAPPAAGGAMDDRVVYVPLQDVTTRVGGDVAVVPGSATITAVNRETGAIRWIRRLATEVPPLVGGDLLFVASHDRVHALAAATGLPQWSAPLDGRVKAPMFLRGSLLIALTEPDHLIALDTGTRAIVWRRPLDESGAVLMNADNRAVYIASAAGRVQCVRLADGTRAWERLLRGTLSEPALGEDRVFVGSTTNAFWALDPDSGRVEWAWDGRIFGGDVIGAAVEDDMVYVASLDNIVRALNRGNGHQRWRTNIGTRPVVPPRVMFGTVVVIGLTPTVTTFIGETGTRVSTWAGPAQAELQGAPLIDAHLKPYGVAMVVIVRDGRVVALRPTAMTFPEPSAPAPTTLPGRPLPVERLPLSDRSSPSFSRP